MRMRNIEIQQCRQDEKFLQFQLGIAQIWCCKVDKFFKKGKFYVIFFRGATQKSCRHHWKLMKTTTNDGQYTVYMGWHLASPTLGKNYLTAGMC